MSDEKNVPVANDAGEASLPTAEGPAEGAKKKPTDRVATLLTIGGIEALCEDLALARCLTEKVKTVLGSDKKAATAIGRLKAQGLVEVSEDKTEISLTEIGLQSYKLAFESQTGSGKRSSGGRKPAASRSKYTFEAGAVIETIVPNPKRAGTLANKRFDLYGVGQSKEEALAALQAGDESCDKGKAITDFNFNIEHGFIKMSGQVEVPKEKEDDGPAEGDGETPPSGDAGAGAGDAAQVEGDAK